MQCSSKSDRKIAGESPHYSIDALVPEIVECLKSNTLLLLEASPGAGKTTRIPPALLKAGYEQIYVLEPRRLAARMAARRVAEEYAQQPGQTVGYQVRFEEVGSRQTKIWFLTEGVLTRKLLTGSTLPGIEVVILDEFHERHLETDLALSLLLRLQQRRADLKVLIMSATLAADKMRAALGNPPLLQSAGRNFPVTVSYRPHSSAPVEEQVAAAVGTALQQTKKDILVFLPGSAEIRKSIQSCESAARPFHAALCALHGDLTADEQDQAVKPSPQRKIICSTNVAESSVTIENVEAVIDSGLARVLTHSAWSGLSHLRVEKISQASAIQRSGRAGRTGPGMAIRLFPETDFVRRPANITPEIIRADFAPTLLQLAASQISWHQLTWLDAPVLENVRHAQELLTSLGALGEDGSITTIGLQMARLSLHPRLARFMVAAAQSGIASEAADLAARLSESRSFASDLDAILALEPTFAIKQVRRQIYHAIKNTPPLASAKHAQDGRGAKRPAERASVLLSSLAVRSRALCAPDPDAMEKALLLAYPDRVAKKRGETLLLANGGAAKLDRQSHVTGDFVLALEIDDRSDQASALVRLAARIEPDWLLDAFPNQIQTSEELTWNRDSERVEQRSLLRYRQLVLDESSSVPRHSPETVRMLVAKALETGVERFTDAEALAQFMLRVHFASEHMEGFEMPPDLFEHALEDLAAGLVSFAELRLAARDNTFIKLLEFRLPMPLVDQVAPAHIVLPSGRHARIEYHDRRPPSVSSRLQDFFGMNTSPTVARGAVALVVQLLAPNHRPVQVTTDLASFWKNLYPQVRRELSRRYPRHSWPETPS